MRMGFWELLIGIGIVALILGLIVFGVVRALRKKPNGSGGRFAEVERQVGVLRGKVADGLLAEDECKARMRELMVAGPDGRWWMVGYKTREWYAHDGTGWVKANPPGIKRSV